MPEPSLFTGMPVILVSDLLAQAQLQSWSGLRLVSFRLLGHDRICFAPDQATPPPDTLLAVVAGAAEDAALRLAFERQDLKLPRLCHVRALSDALPDALEALAGAFDAAAHREAGLREALMGMREEAEETREALRRMCASAAAALPAGPAVLAYERPPAGEDAALVLTGAFSVSTQTPVELLGVSAVALHIAGCRTGAEDRLRMRLQGGESGRVLGAWNLAEAAMPAAGWLTLDAPWPIEAARETAVLAVEGDLASENWLALSQAATTEEAENIAVRLYRAAAPRIVASPCWDRDAVAGWHPDLADELPQAIPMRFWNDAVLLGPARPVPTEDGTRRVRLAAGASAALVFPGIALGTAAAVLARLRCHGGNGAEMAVAMALLPASPALPDNLAAAVDAAGPWSAIASFGTASADAAPEVMTVLPLPPWTRASGPVMVALRHRGERCGDFADLSCEGIFLLPRTGAAPASPQSLFVARGDGAVSMVTFEQVKLDEIFTTDGYRHLDLSLWRLADGALSWEHVKFKLFEEARRSGLEFRSGAGWAPLFRAWPGNAEDAFGKVYKLAGAEALAEAIGGLPEARDRALLAAIAALLPHIVQTLAARGLADAEDWLGVARHLRPGLVEALS